MTTSRPLGAGRAGREAGARPGRARGPRERGEAGAAGGPDLGDQLVARRAPPGGVEAERGLLDDVDRAGGEGLDAGGAAGAGER